MAENTRSGGVHSDVVRCGMPGRCPAVDAGSRGYLRALANMVEAERVSKVDWLVVAAFLLGALISTALDDCGTRLDGALQVFEARSGIVSLHEDVGPADARLSKRSGCAGYAMPAR